LKIIIEIPRLIEEDVVNNSLSMSIFPTIYCITNKKKTLPIKSTLLPTHQGRLKRRTCTPPPPTHTPRDKPISPLHGATVGPHQPPGDWDAPEIYKEERIKDTNE
jgi:hypothetical protein